MNRTIIIRRISALSILVSLVVLVITGISEAPKLLAYVTFQEGLRTLGGKVLDSPADALSDGGDLAFVVFWHSSCQACQKQMKELSEWDTQGDPALRDRVFVATVNVGESEFAVRRFLAMNDIEIDTFPILLGRALGGAVPTIVYLERFTTGDWQAIDSSEGYRSKESLAGAAMQILEYIDGLETGGTE